MYCNIFKGGCQVDNEEKVEVTDTEEEVKEETQNEEALDKPDLETRFNEMMALVTQLQNDVSHLTQIIDTQNPVVVEEEQKEEEEKEPEEKVDVDELDKFLTEY